MYAFFSNELLEGRRFFHKWQVEENLRICKDYSQHNPLKYILCACNGSGKDSFVIAPVAVFLAACKIRHRVIISSSSYNQLHTQTESYISDYCKRINKKLEFEVFSIKLGHIICNITGSEIKMFVTDEAGKAEGYHPFDDCPTPDDGMTIILNESKSIRKEMFQAFARCTGYSRWIEVSSPGKTSGHMYEAYKLSTTFPQAYILGKWYSRKVTVFDCPHISKSSLQDDAELYGGVNSEYYRSKNLAEFTSVDERVVVTNEQVKSCLAFPPEWNKDTTVTGGLDLSGGLDEIVVSSRTGNWLKHIIPIRIKDADLLIAWLETTGFPQAGLDKTTTIYADAGGMGEPIVDILIARGWKIVGVLNQHKAFNSRLYTNRGTENWFNLGNAIRQKNIILVNDEKFIDQLGKRHYDLPDNNKIGLLSKQAERAEGNESPDRADSVALCFMNFEISSTTNLKKALGAGATGVQRFPDQQALLEAMSEKKFAGFAGETNIGKGILPEDRGVFSQRTILEHMLEEHNNNLRRN